MIPQIEPWIDETELGYLRRIGLTTYVTEGPLTEEFEARIKELTGAEHVIAYVNGTLAQFAILRAVGIGPGDEVVVPDMTFIATCNAVLLAGATPVLCDIGPGTLALDPGALAACVTTRTRAVVPVHLYGGMADIEAIRSITEPRGISIIEDAAQAVGVRRNGRHAGTFGRAGYLSFYGNKTMTTGEGAVILTDDPDIAKACYRLKNHGRDRKGVFVHDHIGFNFSFTDLQAAVGLGQLDKLAEIIRRKRSLRSLYKQNLGGLDGVEFQEFPEDVDHVPWFTNIFVDEAGALAEFLAKREIGSRRFFYPLHRQPCYAGNIVVKTDCRESDHAYRRGLSLPSSATLDEKDALRICEAIRQFFTDQA